MGGGRLGGFCMGSESDDDLKVAVYASILSIVTSLFQE